MEVVDTLAQADVEEQMAGLRLEHANMLQREAADARRAGEERRLETRQTFDELSEMNAAIMDQRINPARFFTSGGAGTGLAAAASVALGVLGQALSPGMENSALSIINRAVERDVAAQVTDLQNQRAGVQTARNLFGDLMAMYRNEDVARDALRSLYLSEMERRIQAMAAQTQSQATRRNAERIVAAVAEQRITAAASAARERTRVIYSENMTGRQAFGSTQGVRSAASQIRASSPLHATGVAQAMQQHGVLAPQGAQQPGAAALGGSPVQSPGSALAPPGGPGGGITSQDLRQRGGGGGGAAAARANVQAERAESNVSEDSSQPPFDRRMTRRAYRSAAGGIQGGVVPTPTSVATPDGPVLAIRTGERMSTQAGGQGADVQFIRPLMSNGQMVAVSQNGRSRRVRPGEALRSNERLAGAIYTQELRPMPAESARYHAQTSQDMPIGMGWSVRREALQRMDQREVNRNIQAIGLVREGRHLAQRLDRLMQQFDSGAIDINSADMQGLIGADAMALQGRFASAAQLGVLQEGEREAIRDMTSLPSGSENWVLFFTESDRARGAIRGMLRQFNDTLRHNRLSPFLYRNAPTAREVTESHQR